MERIAVIVPCHDNAAHVGAALESVLGQTQKPDEVIVVDDGSRDDSRDIVRTFGDRVRLIVQPNLGAAAARNAGIAASVAPQIAFLDADDVWPADSLERRLAVLTEGGADIVYGGVRQCLDGAGMEARAVGPVIAGRLAGAMLVRRSAFDRIGAFDERLATAETIDWVARAQAAGLCASRCDGIVLFRRIHATNLMRRTVAPEQNCLAVLRGAVRRGRESASC